MNMALIKAESWIAKYDSKGNQLWLEQFGTSELDNAYEVL